MATRKKAQGKETATAPEGDPLARLDIDTLAEKWATPSPDGGWGDEENAIYQALDGEAQARLIAEFEKRAGRK